MQVKKYQSLEFERNEFGYMVCETGDYTALREIPERCIFKPRSRFRNAVVGNMCNFGDGCEFENVQFGDGCGMVNGKCKGKVTHGRCFTALNTKGKGGMCR